MKAVKLMVAVALMAVMATAAQAKQGDNFGLSAECREYAQDLRAVVDRNGYADATVNSCRVKSRSGLNGATIKFAVSIEGNLAPATLNVTCDPTACK